MDSGLDFQFVGNDRALDLVNTRLVTGGHNVDLIFGEERLSAWLSHIEDAPKISAWTRQDVEELHLLRAACRAIFEAKVAGQVVEPSDVEVINRHLAQNRSAPVLKLVQDDFVLEDAPTEMSPGEFLSDIASRMAQLLTSTDPARLKICAHQDCALTFKDVSKSGRRRWCSMELCGNRAKVATFRATARP